VANRLDKQAVWWLTGSDFRTMLLALRRQWRFRLCTRCVNLIILRFIFLSNNKFYLMIFCTYVGEGLLRLLMLLHLFACERVLILFSKGLF